MSRVAGSLRRSQVARAALLSLAVLGAARAEAPVLLHEPIPPDPRDDLALGITLDGDLAAAIETSSGLVAAPDPRRPVGQRERKLGPFESLQGHPLDTGGASTYTPDTDTRRPDALPYDDPFTPSTAPFKRLVAFDAVDSSYRLVVRDPILTPLVVSGPMRADGSEESFFADLVVSPSRGRRVRIPSVGPGARVVHAWLGSGPRELAFALWRDGAENWFVEANETGRLVMELTAPRAAFGGNFGDPHPSDLHAPNLPANVLRDANRVAAAIGVDRTSPRETVRRLVAYFRSFRDSDEGPAGRGNPYLDLALSQKGVCRHRAYAFTVTALALGIPTRMVMNEAHAWVEVYDGSLWRRIDLGGAGRALGDGEGSAVSYAPPPDPFAWPPDAEHGDDPAIRARRAATAAPTEGNGRAMSEAASLASPPTSSGPATIPGKGAEGTTAPSEETRTITLELVESDAIRGAPLHVRGQVRAGTYPCPYALVLLTLRDARSGRKVSLGGLATDEAGAFSGAVVVPSATRVGDYELVAQTSGGPGCPEGSAR